MRPKEFGMQRHIEKFSAIIIIDFLKVLMVAAFVSNKPFAFFPFFLNKQDLLIKINHFFSLDSKLLRYNALEKKRAEGERERERKFSTYFDVPIHFLVVFVYTHCAHHFLDLFDVRAKIK